MQARRAARVGRRSRRRRRRRRRRSAARPSRVEPAEVRQEAASRWIVCPPISSSSSACWMSGSDAARVDDVGGEERLHLAGDREHRRLGRRRRRSTARCGSARRSCPSPPRRGRATAAGCAARASCRRARRSSRPRRVCASARRRSWLICVCTSTGDVPPVVSASKNCVGVGVGLLDDARDVAVVVLQRVLLAAVEAAVDAEHEHDDHDQADARRDEAAHAQLLGVRARPAAAARSRARVAGCGSCGARHRRRRTGVRSLAKVRRWLSMTRAP